MSENLDDVVDGFQYELENARDDLSSIREAIREIIPSIIQLKRKHFTVVDDSWYNCPMSEEGCCDDSKKKECNCGADKHNLLIDSIVERLKNL